MRRQKPASRSRQEWPGIQQRSIIALVPSPSWVSGECIDMHRRESAHHRPVLYIGSDYVNEVASGGINGLLMMVATVVAGIGIDLPGPHILAMGSASLISYGFSMGFGAFMVEEAKEGFARSQLEEEYNEVRAMPSAEVDEMICHYRKRGLSEEDARHVAKIFSKYEDFWVHHMMAEELGIQLPRGPTAAMKSGLATGTSFLIFGLVPLLGLVISTCLRSCAGPAWYRPQFSTAMSLTLSAFALLLLGSLVSRLVGSRTPLVSGMTMLANGFAASIMAFAVSQLLSTEMEKKALGAKVSEVDEVPQPVAKRCPKRLRLDSGSSQPGSGVQMSEPGAWPTFRHQFFLSSFMLWVAVCSAIVAWQTFSRAYVAFERMHWEVIRVFGYGLPGAQREGSREGTQDARTAGTEDVAFKAPSCSTVLRAIHFVAFATAETSKEDEGLASEIPGVGTTIPVYSLGGQRLADLAVGPDETVAALKEKLCEATGRNQLMDLASELLILQDSDIVWKTGILEGGHLQALVPRVSRFSSVSGHGSHHFGVYLNADGNASIFSWQTRVVNRREDEEHLQTTLWGSWTLSGPDNAVEVQVTQMERKVFNESVPHGWTQQTGKTDAEVTMRFSWQRRLLKFLGTAGPTSGLGILASVLLQFPDELLAAGTDDRHVFDAWYAAGTSTEP
ncbi:Vacuolar iron transporter 1 (OsVIT1) [Durusdinium trenchii]|uniref:Vacuolar iron transporter 1 (OsVIT1) n=1 Tax=Durusdinium trenchii TaxID=1381693 RepID=A0ABP0P9L2_9DINO